MAIRTRPIALLFAAALLVLLRGEHLDACSCVADVPLCESVWASDVVFEGEVTAIEASTATDSFPSRRVQFTVTRAWRGETGGSSIDIHTGSGGGDCGYGFRQGRKYLVYAARYEGRLTTNICSPTKPIERAAQDIEYLSSAETSTGGRIYGIVRTSNGQPVSRYTVILRGAPDGQRQAVTRGSGEFEFTAVPAGEYSVRVVVHPGERAYGREDVNLRDPRACARRDFTIE